MNDQLAGKRCVVTGGGRGIGEAISLELARRGAAAVAILGTNEEKGRETAGLVEEEGAKAVFVTCDVSDAAQVKDAIEESATAMSGMDVLVNNAAIIDSQLTDRLRLDALPVEVWDRVYAVNVRGTWLTMKYAVPHLARGRNPVIVNCASVSGGILTFPGESCYGSTKAAVIQMTRTAALDFQPLGIRAVCYSPGTIGTDMVEEQIEAAEDPAAQRQEFARWHLTAEPRLGDPAEIARVVCFLASDDASFVNGADLRADAGLSVWRGSF